MDYYELEELLSHLTNNQIIPAISIAIGYKNQIIFKKACGMICESNQVVNDNSRFDIASMTKILTGICFMKLVEQHKIELQDPIYKYFSDFNRVKPIEKDGKTIDYCDCSKITWYHVLTHTSGMGWTRPKTRPSLPHLDKGLEDIYELPLAYLPGTRIVYSDVPIILMGMAMEQITGCPLDTLVDDMVCKPLGMNHTGFLRRTAFAGDKRNIVPTEEDLIFRKERVWGAVHDENAYLLDGVAAHAGIFSTATDMCNLAMQYNGCLNQDGLLKSDTVSQMISELVEEDGDRRGLIWQLSGCSEKAYTRFLSTRSYGHTGFTGCFLWNDPEKDLSIVLLSNDVYRGRDDRKIFEYRSQIMELITKEL